LNHSGIEKTQLKAHWIVYLLFGTTD